MLFTDNNQEKVNKNTQENNHNIHDTAESSITLCEFYATLTLPLLIFPSCTIKSGSTLLALAYPGGPGSEVK